MWYIVCLDHNLQTRYFSGIKGGSASFGVPFSRKNAVQFTNRDAAITVLDRLSEEYRKGNWKAGWHAASLHYPDMQQ